MAYLEYTDTDRSLTVVNLTDDSITIGRDHDCKISLLDRRISRHNTVIYKNNDGWHVKDLESTNGTIVNGFVVKDTLLVDNDIIVIGPLILSFIDNGESEEIGEPSVVLNQDELTKAVSQATSDHSLVSNEDKRLKLLLDVSWALDSLGTTKELLMHFMDALMGMFTPDTCIVALKDEYLRHPVLTKESGRDPNEHSIAKIMAVARDKKQGVIFDNSNNEKDSDIPISQMCAPVMLQGMMRGVIYLDRRDKNRDVFIEEDMRLMVVFGRLMSSAATGSERLERLDAENEILAKRSNRVGLIIGNSPKTKKLLDIIENKLAIVDTTVLFTGETGTGKTLAAEALHMASKRRKKPFIKINCAAIPDNLIESELFGHEKGAFSGADSPKAGLFELANGGTLFLDEIGELNFASQSKLLTVLHDRKLQRLGGARQIPINIRLVAATNSDLQKSVTNGTFRSDLYYRLNTVQLKIPSLRERAEDIKLLALFFLDKFCKIMAKNIIGINSDAMTALNTYTWPGNIRELSNAIERAVIFADNRSSVTLDLLPDDIALSGASDMISNNFMDQIEGFTDIKSNNLQNFDQSDLKNSNFDNSDNESSEKEMLVKILKKAKGNKRQAARMLGWYPQKFYARLKQYNLL